MDFTLSPQSARLVVELLKKEIQRLAIDANVYELYHVDVPTARRASLRRRELIAVLDELKEQEPA